MCGIAGFFNSQSSPEKIQKMLSSLQSRGPDAQHWKGWDENEADERLNPTHALLHTRLSIRDPRSISDQPMSAGEDLWVSYNGEIYGWEEDAEYLRKKGVVFRTRSDTEFILHAYHYWGLDGLLKRLRGMFAIAILDWKQKKVWLIRDRLGLKPLIYSHNKKGLAFSSLVRTLIPWLPPKDRAFSSQAIDAFLTHRYIPAPNTIFKNINRLENGHYLEYCIKTGSLDKHCYWSSPSEPADYQALLDESIKIRTVSDRPLGIFLSGGIDSSVITSRLTSLGFNSFETFTAAFPGTGFDESDVAAQTSNILNLKNNKVDIPETLEGSFDQIIADLDEPFADPSAFPLWFLAKQTSQKVKVVLNGDGGDELLAGYKRYQQHMKSVWRKSFKLSGSCPSSLKRKGLDSSLLQPDKFPWFLYQCLHHPKC